MKTTEQKIERIENLGGTIYGNEYALFVFTEPVSTDGGESITLKKACDVESQMIDQGYEGALIGHPLDSSDLNCIHFKL